MSFVGRKRSCSIFTSDENIVDNSLLIIYSVGNVYCNRSANLKCAKDNLTNAGYIIAFESNLMCMKHAKNVVIDTKRAKTCMDPFIIPFTKSEDGLPSGCSSFAPSAFSFLSGCRSERQITVYVALSNWFDTQDQKVRPCSTMASLQFLTCLILCMFKISNPTFLLLKLCSWSSKTQRFRRGSSTC